MCSNIFFLDKVNKGALSKLLNKYEEEETLFEVKKTQRKTK